MKYSIILSIFLSLESDKERKDIDFYYTPIYNHYKK